MATAQEVLHALETDEDFLRLPVELKDAVKEAIPDFLAKITHWLDIPMTPKIYILASGLFTQDCIKRGFIPQSKEAHQRILKDTEAVMTGVMEGPVYHESFVDSYPIWIKTEVERRFVLESWKSQEDYWVSTIGNEPFAPEFAQELKLHARNLLYLGQLCLGDLLVLQPSIILIQI